MPPKLQERDFAGTPRVPVYVMLPVSVLFAPIVPFLSFLCVFGYFTVHFSVEELS